VPPSYLVRYTLFLVLMATGLYCDAPFVVQVSKSLLSLHTWFDVVAVRESYLMSCSVFPVRLAGSHAVTEAV